MRVAIISNFISGPNRGGAERYATMLAISLAGEGHEVTFYTGSRDHVDGVICRRLPGLPEINPGASTVHKAAWHFREQWIPAVHRELRRALQADPPDVVHSHEPQLLSAAVFTAIASADLPHVHTAHDFNLLCARVTMTRDAQPCDQKCFGCRLQRAVRVGAIQQRLDLLLAPSDFVRERHLEYGVVSPERALTIRQGALPGLRRLRDPLSGELHLGFLGTLSNHKGVRTLLRAVALMPTSWSLTLAGDGPLANEVRASAAQDSRITYIGPVGDAERDVFLNELDILVIPSEWEEPAPLVATEAAVRGLPAIVSDRGGLPETPEASVFAAGSPEALVKAVEEVDRVPGLITLRSRSLLNSSTAHEWPTHLRAVENALSRAVEDI